MANTPNVRFKGFADDWEQRKLGNIIIDYSEKNPDDEDLPVLTSSRQGIQKQEEHFGSEQKHDTTDYNVIPKGYCTYRNRSDDKTFTFNVNDCVERGIVSKFYPVFGIENGNAKFITEYLNTNAEIRNKLAVLAVGTSQVVLSLKNLKALEILVPSKEEQDKVGQVIISLDHFITLHQRKCDEVRHLKKFMLQKMFPKSGELIPEIRFAGFTDDWEQRKLGEVLEDLYNGQTPSRSRDAYWNGEISWLSSGELNRGIVYKSVETITEAGRESVHLRMVPKGTFVMAITGLEAAGTRGNCAILGFDTTLNQSCMALFPKKNMLSSAFLFQWYRMVGEDYGIKFTQGTKQQSYNAEIIKDLDICLPQLVEQKKISSALQNLDHLITLHQRKCDELKEVKRFMLQNMFPQKG